MVNDIIVVQTYSIAEYGRREAPLGPSRLVELVEVARNLEDGVAAGTGTLEDNVLL